MRTRKSMWATPPTPERIREARNARGRTIADMAVRLNKTRQAISNYENGNREPAPDVMRDLSESLNFPMSFFFPQLSDDFHFETSTHFRSMKTTENAHKLMFNVRLLWTARLLRDLAAYIRLPDVKLCDPIEIPLDMSAETINVIEASARELRSFWGLGMRPISNITRLAEANGIVICAVDCGTTKIDACSQIIDKRALIMLSQDKESACRLRFDIMHEIGHLLFHRDIPIDELEDTKTFDIVEKQAHRFASAFLMPEDTFPNEVYTASLGESMLELKKRWGVSLGAIIYRCKDLGIYSDEQTQRLFIERSRKKWKTKEPLDDKMPIERPILLKRAYEYIENKDSSIPQMLFEQSSICKSDFEALTNYSIVEEVPHDSAPSIKLSVVK